VTVKQERPYLDGTPRDVWRERTLSLKVGRKTRANGLKSLIWWKKKQVFAAHFSGCFAGVFSPKPPFTGQSGAFRPQTQSASTVG
jgi:hypothetical protein